MLWALYASSFSQLLEHRPLTISVPSCLQGIGGALCLPLIGNWQQRAAAINSLLRLKIKIPEKALLVLAWALLLVLWLSVTLARRGSNALYRESWDDCKASSPENVKLGKAKSDCKRALCLEERKNNRPETKA